MINKVIEDITLFLRNEEKVLHELESKKDKLNLELVDKYASIKSLDDLSKHIEQETKKDKKLSEIIKHKMDQDHSKHLADMEKADLALKEKKNKIEELTTLLNHRKEEIKNLPKEIKIVDKLKSDKTKLLKELSDLTKKLTEVKDEYTDREKEVDDIIKNKVKAIDVIKKEIEKLEEDRVRRNKDLLPRKEDLDKREAEIKDKEVNLKIVIDRYKRKFAENDSDFKV
jgi:DNA repair exonuclease SbcCD ATPase subunit